MDNITHALVGAALADGVLPRGATSAARRAFIVAGVVAANAPDIDLVYSGITAAPLGYLLHHRGHSHTVPGLVVLGLLIAGICRVWPGGRAAMAAAPGRFTALIAVALLSHLVLDAGNSYGTHLFYPFASGWYFGDAVFIFEPWLWVLLGVAVALNAQAVWPRRLVWLLAIVPTTALAAIGLISPVVLGVLGVAGLALAACLVPRAPATRATVALLGAAVFCGALFGVSRLAHARVRALLPAAVVDIVLNPNPAVPWCWAVVTVERVDDGAALRVRRGTLSLWPRVEPAAGCASHRLLAAADGTVVPESSDQMIWNREWRVDLNQLRALDATDCRARAWLQFGRVPFVSDGRIADLRFDTPFGSTFSAMDVGEPGRSGNGCPTHLTDWEPPRRDVLAR